VRGLSWRIYLPRSTVHRAPEPAPTLHAITSLHFTSRCDIFDGSPTFDRETEAESGPGGNRTISDPLDANEAPMARHCHLGRVVNLFVQ
jgi:hypothetical protein